MFRNLNFLLCKTIGDKGKPYSFAYGFLQGSSKLLFIYLLWLKHIFMYISLVCCIILYFISYFLDAFNRV